MPCPSCGSYDTIKNGKSPNGYQRYKCKNCGRSYTAGASVSHAKNKTSSTTYSPAKKITHKSNPNLKYEMLFGGLALTTACIITLNIFGVSTLSVMILIVGVILCVTGIATVAYGKYSNYKNNKIKAKKIAYEEDTNFRIKLDVPNSEPNITNNNVTNDIDIYDAELPDNYSGKIRTYTFDDVDVCIIDGQEPDFDAINVGNMVTLKKEPDNPYDGNAVALYVNDIKLGYLYRGKIQDIANEYLNASDIKHILGIITSVYDPKIKIDIGLYK